MQEHYYTNTKKKEEKLGLTKKKIRISTYVLNNRQRCTISKNWQSLRRL